MHSTDSGRRTLTARRVDSVETAPRVRHVDQLSETALERFTAAVQRDASPGARDREALADGGDGVRSSFVDAEVIVFTDYYRIDLG